LEKEKEEETDLVIDQGDQEAILWALNATSAIKRAIGHLNALLTSQTAKAAGEELTNLGVLQI